MTVISANVGGLTASKASILSVMGKEQHSHGPRNCQPKRKSSKRIRQSMDNVEVSKSTTYRIHMQQITETEMGVLRMRRHV